MKSIPVSVLAVLCVTFVSCGKETVSVAPEGDPNVLQNVQVKPPSKEALEGAAAGKEVWFGIAPLQGVEGIAANGVTQSSSFESGEYRHVAQLNIERAPDGFFYEGWLVNPLTGEVVSTGHLRSRFGDVRHSLSFQESDPEIDLTTYIKVIITIEPDDGNPAPDKHVAEATLEIRDR